MRRSKGTRLIKWIGLPPVLRRDGFGVYNWQYENRRHFPVKLPKGGGRTNRVLEAGPYRLKNGETVRLSQTYKWTQDAEYPFVVAVAKADADAIMAIAPTEFLDVTSLDKRLWDGIRNAPVIEGQPREQVIVDDKKVAAHIPR